METGGVVGTDGVEADDVGIAGVVERDDVGRVGWEEEDVGTAAPGCPAERSSASAASPGLCGADTPVRVPAAPPPSTFSAAAGGVEVTTRGPGSNEASPRPKARRFSIFSFSPPCPATFPAVAVVIIVLFMIVLFMCSHSARSTKQCCHPEGPSFGAEGPMQSRVRISTLINLIDRRLSIY